MYCPNCGKEVSEDDNFCKHCSYHLNRSDYIHGVEICGNDPTGRPAETKSTGWAMFLSLILPGAGAIYMGSGTRDILILLASIACVAVWVLFPVLFIPLMIVQFVLWAIGIKDTSDAIDRYRERVPL